mgnify:CR=1 FL=1
MPKNTNIKRVTLIVVLLMSLVEVSSQVRKAFLVGISDYNNSAKVSKSDNEWSNIHGANDIVLLTPMLKKQGFKITSLSNKSATANNIRKGLKSFSSSCQPDDIVYIHFSCHGQPVEDMNGDEEDGWDEALVPVDAKKVYQKGKYEGENHITDDELNGYLKTIRSKLGPQGFVYVIIDACHAGSSYRGDDEEDSVVIRGTNSGFSKSNKPFAPRMNEQSKRSKIKIEKSVSIANICILEACRSFEKNREILENGKYYGSLSYYVNKTLQTIKLEKNVSWTEKVYNNLRKDVRLPQQHPVIETSL